ncbi:hypothetical protein MAHJHV54_48730 [Mycobacterium avium subsp. hominissuis]
MVGALLFGGAPTTARAAATPATTPCDDAEQIIEGVLPTIWIYRKLMLRTLLAHFSANKMDWLVLL